MIENILPAGVASAELLTYPEACGRIRPKSI